jgi:transcriptional regulator with XRE-family HTH domain
MTAPVNQLETSDKGLHVLVGANIRSAREDAGLTQEELSRAAQVSRSTINAIENGHRKQVSPENVRRIALVLQKPEAFFYGVETSTKSLCPTLKSTIGRLASLSLAEQESIAPIIINIIDLLGTKSSNVIEQQE